MTARDIFLGIALVLMVLVLGLIVPGVIVQFEEREQRSQRPEIFRSYRNLWKLFHKQIVAQRPALWLFWAAPVLVPKSSSKSDIDEFLEAAAKLPAASASGRGRLIFALDATMSRQATWDIAQSVQGRMFATAAAYGGLDVQFVYFRGFSEYRASRFMAGAQSFASLMNKIGVGAGQTQIEKVLRHVLAETRKTPVSALVFLGDAMEERLDVLARLAEELGRLGVKTFLFQEGRDSMAEQAFRKIALLTGGAYATFDLSSPERLVALLTAAAAYAAGGRRALEYEARFRGAVAADHLLSQMRQTWGSA
ncbi:MAG: VWA domain-containing protein [Methylocella sp.]